MALNVLEKWTNNCSSLHEKCGSFFDHKPLPTRVINVMSEGDNDTIRLQLSNGESGRYVALSYCWGNPRQLFTTTTATLQERLQAISVNVLPQTFRDAVLLCRALRIQYLWIDALCIIQDDENDWASESVKMGNIYGHSALTVSASMADCVTAGFLSRPQVDTYPSIQWNDRESSQTGRIYMRPISIGWSEVSSKDTPLMRRGWTLQERLLSPRVLHYGQQMYWDCRCCRWSEDEQFNETLDEPSSYRNLGERPFSKDWSEILEDYSGRSLTKEMDKLPALAGLAQIAQKLTEDEYCAGLWLSTLPRDLLWKRDQPGFMGAPSEFRAPTWSWAALDGQIKTWKPSLLDSSTKLTCDSHVEVTISKVSIKHHIHDPFGKVESGYVDMEGPMSVLTPTINAEELNYFDGTSREDNGFEYLVTPDSPTETRWTCMFDREVDFRSKRPWLLRIMVDIYYPESNYGNRISAFNYGGLVVERVENIGGLEHPMYHGPHHCYRRLGWASFNVSNYNIELGHGYGYRPWPASDRPWGRHKNNMWHTQTLRLI